jgi:hypothetical protein
LCKRVRPRNNSLVAPKRVSRKSIAVLGHTWLSFIKTTAQFFKHVRIGETPVLDIPNLPELPGFTKEPVVIWLSQMCLWAMGYVSEKTGCLVFFFKWEPRLGALRTAVMPWSSLLQVQEWSTYT